MLSSDDNQGVISFLTCLIILVMAGVGLSLLVDRRFQFSSAGMEMRREIESEKSQIADLKGALEDGSKQLAENGERLTREALAHRQLSEKLAGSRALHTDLTNRRDTLKNEVAALEAEFARYRADYRRKEWASAVGESLGDLRTRDGREYLKAAITKVTDVGLEIRHEHGIARIRGTDLDESFRDRFQWDDEEIRKRLHEESAVLASIGTVVKPPETDPVGAAKREKTRLAREQREERRNEIKKRQQVVRAWRMKVRTLMDEGKAVSAGAAAGGGSSVPGSLETWQARGARISRELVQAKASLEVARRELAEVSPSDSLLRAPPDDR